jgi:hypothetical protein
MSYTGVMVAGRYRLEAWIAAGGADDVWRAVEAPTPGQGQ